MSEPAPRDWTWRLMPDRVAREFAIAPAPQLIGHVTGVSGARMTGVADGDPATSIQLGAMVKVPGPDSTVFGLVSGLTLAGEISEGARGSIEVELLGEVVDDSGKFRRGVTRYPTLGREIQAADHDDLTLIYTRPDVPTVRVGTLFQDRDLPVYARTDELLGKHFAVLGTSGTGKSCAVTLILQAVLDRNPNGHVIMLDPHNEYAPAFNGAAEVLSPDNLQLPYWMLNFEESRALFVGRDRGSDAESAIIGTAILAAKRKFVGTPEAGKQITVDTPVPYSMSELLHNIDAAMGQLDKPEDSAPYLRLKSRIESLRADGRYKFLFSGLVVRDNLAQIVSRIIRVPVAGKPLTIIDLSGIPSEVVDVVVSVLCRMIFDIAVWSETPGAVPMLLVCEEAHRYVPARDDLGFEPTKRAIARIAKEGRKYGVSLALISQRPAELSPDILSQCSTLFALRMGNERDQEFVRRTLPESAMSLVSALAALGTQEAVAVGEGVPVPMRMRFDDLPPKRRPVGGASTFSAAWANDCATEDAIARTVERWRRQIR
ncbi:MAG: ATP-binding protein [Rhodospirillales bacterium]